MTESSEVREFYDKFSERVLVRDFYYVNLRHEAIKRLCDSYIPARSSVLEIGCGVGIVTRYLQKRASRLAAVDISAKNVEIAKEFVGNGVQFEVVDVLESGGALERYAPYDVVLLADVVEHIPKGKHGDLFAFIEGVLSATGRVVLTYPSPEVQAHMRSYQPDDVQVIDESIEFAEILAVTSLKPLYFSYRSVFGTNDYVHAVLCTNRVFSAEAASRPGWLASRLRKYRWRFGNLPFLRRLRRKNIIG